MSRADGPCYLDPHTSEILDSRASGGFRNRSSAITTIVDRYAEICRRSVPSLTVAEWKLCADSLNGVWMQEASMLGMTWGGIADSIRLDRLDQKWEVDGPALVRKLQALSYAETIALVDLVERFWGDETGGFKFPGEEPVAPPRSAPR